VSAREGDHGVPIETLTDDDLVEVRAQLAVQGVRS